MDLDMQINALGRLYGLYENALGGLDLACEKGCAHCCTVNVTLTSLEALYMLMELPERQAPDFWRIVESVGDKPRFRPGYTINALAQTCLDGEALPEEANDPEWGACPALTDNLCSIYGIRPFGCRCMVSHANCGEVGFANMSDRVATLNEVFCQAIEHLDAGGITGNFSDVLAFMKSEKNRLRYHNSGRIAASPPLVANRPISVLMIPPEHRKRLAPLLKSIHEIIG